MKVLMLAPYVTINDRPEFSKNKTGFGYMVYDIARAVARTEKVEALASDCLGKEFEREGVKFLKRSIGICFLHFFRCLSPLVVWRMWRKYRMRAGSLTRLVYCWFISGYYCSVVCEGNYDIVHIHGCGFATELWMRVCKKCNQKFIVTLHGLNSFSDSVKLEKAGKQYERDFLKRVVDGEMPITVISTGMKRTIEKEYGVTNCNSITVVCNSYSFSNEKEISFSVRKKYGIPLDAKVLLYVGNISVNKNQIQMVKAFDLLQDHLRHQTWVLFCGNNHMGDNASFENAIKQSLNVNHMVLCGGVNKELMPDYYRAANAVVLLSKTEGFGLSLIEGMHFGLPGLMFTDMDAYEDIYNESAVIGVPDRDSQSVAEGIGKLLTNNWEEEIIKKYSQKFESKTMAHNYISQYQLYNNK